MTVLRAPFPWFGGKSRAAALIWSRLGRVPNYVEAFAGSLATLLGRPDAPRLETVNDIDCHIANFWRSLAQDPDRVAFWCDWPVNEADLHARHSWLVHATAGQRQRIREDPEFYDAKIAGWWVWGQSLWIGSGWCRTGDQHEKLPSIGRGGERGVTAGTLWQKRFAMNGHGHAPGIHRQSLSASARRWNSGGRGGGSGVHAPGLRPARSHLSSNGMGITLENEGLYDYLQGLAVRMRRVRVCCGDWKRVLTPAVTTYNGLTGVVLDPPYDDELRSDALYAHDSGTVSADVRGWAIENGDNPEFRIALCGYQGEHEMPASWECVAWKAHGGYSRTEQGQANRELERIWFSPHCLRPGDRLPFEA